MNPLVERFQYLRREAFVLDTETTGSNRQNDEVIELGVVRAANGEVVISSRFQPSKKVEVWAYRVHKISDRELSGKPRFAARWMEYLELLNGAIIAGWNIAFDQQMLDATCARYGLPTLEAEWVDLMPLYRQFKGLPKNCKLSEACEQMRVKAGDHSAVNDALAAARVVYAIASKSADVPPAPQPELFGGELVHRWEVAEIEDWYAEDSASESVEETQVVTVAEYESDATYYVPQLEDGRIHFRAPTRFRYRWWKPGGQSLAQTLADLDAPADVIRRYLGKSDAPLHTALGVQDCKGEAVTLPELTYCVGCGWFYEATAVSAAEQHSQQLKMELGF